MVSQTELRSKQLQDISSQIASSRQDIEKQRKLLTQAEKQPTATKSQLLTQTRTQALQLKQVKSQRLKQIAESRQELIAREESLKGVERQVASQKKEITDFQKAKQAADAFGRGSTFAGLALSGAQKNIFQQIIKGQKAFKERTTAIKELGEGVFAKGIEKVKLQKDIVKEFGDLSKVDLQKLSAVELTRFEKAGLVTVTRPEVIEQKLEETIQEAAEVKKRSLLKRIISPVIIPAREVKIQVPQFGTVTADAPTGFKETIITTKPVTLGAAITTIAKAPLIFAKKAGELAEKGTELAFKTIAPEFKGIDIKQKAIEVKIQVPQFGTVTPDAPTGFKEKLFTAPERIVPIFEPKKVAEAVGIGTELGLIVAAPTLVVSPGFVAEGVERALDPTLTTKERLFGVVEAEIGLLGIGLGLNQLSKFSKVAKVDDVVTTKVSSGNVRTQHINRVLKTVDKKILGQINTNKLSIGRVYQTTVGTGKNAKTLLFVELGKGTRGSKAFTGSRKLFGVELSSKGKVISEFKGIGIERAPADVSRSITQVIKKTRKGGIFKIGSKEEKQLFRFIEETKGKSVELGTFKLKVGKGQVRLVKETQKFIGITDKELKALAKSQKESAALEKFFKGKGEITLGKKISTTESLVIGKDVFAKGKLSAQEKLGLIGVTKKIEVRGIEGGKIFSTKAFEAPKLTAPKVGGVTQSKKIIKLRGKLSRQGKIQFDKLSKIEKNFIESQHAINLKSRTGDIGLSTKQINERLITQQKTQLGGQVVQLRPTDLPVSGVPAALGQVLLTAPKVAKVSTALITAQKVSAALLSVQKPKQDVKLKPTTKTDQQIQQIIKSDVAAASKSASATFAVSVQEPVLQVQQPVTALTPTPTPTPTIPAAAFVPPLISADSQRVKTAFAEKKRTTGWIPEIKEKGKFKRFTLPFKTEIQAKKFARWAVDNSTSAQYRLKPVTNVKRFSKKVVPETSPLKYRDFRLVKGKKARLKNFGEIEKRGPARIDTRGEKLGLKTAKIIAQRFAKKKVPLGVASSILKSPPKLKINK